MGDNSSQKFEVLDRRSEMGRSRVLIRCPFCLSQFWAYIWSISGGGKRCECCGSMHGSFGQAQPPELPKAQLGALRWLIANGGLEVPNMDLNGRSPEWPTAATLRALEKRNLISFWPNRTTWRVDVLSSGRKVAELLA